MSTKQGRSRTISLMWASFILFSSDSHHCSSAGHSEISNISSLVSCCMLSGKDSMTLQLLIQSSFREVRHAMISCRLLRFLHHEILNFWRAVRCPNHSGSCAWSPKCTGRLWREERARMISGELVRWLQSLMYKLGRAGRWQSNLHWCIGSSLPHIFRVVTRGEEEVEALACDALFPHDDITPSQYSPHLSFGRARLQPQLGTRSYFQDTKAGEHVPAHTTPTIRACCLPHSEVWHIV